MTDNKTDGDKSSTSADHGAASNVSHGRRNPRDFTVETYSKGRETTPFFTHQAMLEEATGLSESVNENLDALKFDEDGCEANSDKINFISGNPFVETTRGILHLYKENTLTSLEAGSSRCDSVCIIAVPASMTCTDLLTFTAACHDDIKHLRIIQDGTLNQYMALLTFRTQQMAREFYNSFNGISFNTLEPECVCRLVFVSSVKVETSSPQPPPMHTELPTCPVCLERMDESVDGILTILCNHSFHSNCLAKWGDTSCPVCRYFQTPELLADNRCLQCLSEENLWICLICGHVGCGRYVGGHAYKHYAETQHCYAMQLGSNRVWDYAGDNFVHRLLQNKGDGKLVEGEQPSKEQGLDEKMDSMQLEWTYNLTSQLEKQKVYFEDKLSRLQQSLSSESAELRQKLVKTVDDNKTLQAQLKEMKNEKVSLEKKVAHLHSRLAAAQLQLLEERELGRALQTNQKEWQTKFTQLEDKYMSTQEAKQKEIQEIKEQLRDVMFYLEAQKQIGSSDIREEIAEGQIVVPEPTKPSRQRKRRS